jgi:hypothetical protein
LNQILPIREYPPIAPGWEIALAVLRVTIHSDKFVVALIDSGWLDPE